MSDDFTVVSSENIAYLKGCENLLKELYMAGNWTRDGFEIEEDTQLWHKVKVHTGWSTKDA